MENLKNKKAFVAGGTSSVGLEIVKQLCRECKEVFFTGRHFPEQFEQLNDSEKNKLRFIPWTFPLLCRENPDAESKEFSAGTLESFINNKEISQALSDCDILVVSYGPFVQKSLHETTAAEWAGLALMDLALPGTLCSKVLPSMINKNWGRIVLFGGTRTETVRAYKTTAAYSAVKTSVAVLAKSIAAQYAQNGITCNVILPGFTSNAPENTVITSEEALASKVLFLIENNELNGVLLNVDRGWQGSEFGKKL